MVRASWNACRRPTPRRSDQELVRAGFAALLDAEDDIDVVGEAADGDQAMQLAARSAPDVRI